LTGKNTALGGDKGTRRFKEVGEFSTDVIKERLPQHQNAGGDLSPSKTAERGSCKEEVGDFRGGKVVTLGWHVRERSARRDQENIEDASDCLQVLAPYLKSRVLFEHKGEENGRRERVKKRAVLRNPQGREGQFHLRVEGKTSKSNRGGREVDR